MSGPRDAARNATLPAPGLIALAAAIAGGEVSAESAVLAAITRADALTDINAVVAMDIDQTLATARQRDDERAAGRLRGVLHGVPLAHKDMFHRAGKVSGYGSRICAEHVPQETSPLIARLEAAGAITLGRLHMAEFALGPTGHNAHLGRCRNPWHREAITGGSSSGSGAAVAAGIVTGALGSDTGGSIRLPAAFCGVAGLKPTHGRLTTSGMMPLSASMDVPGPLARSSHDLARLMTVLCGTGEDFEAALAGHLRGLRIGVPSSYYVEGLDPEVAAALAVARGVLRDLGASVIDVAVPDQAPYTRLAAEIWAPEAATVHADRLATRAQDYGEQVRNRLLEGARVGPEAYRAALAGRAAAQAEMLTGPLTICDMLLTPAARTTVPMADAVSATAGPAMAAMIGEISAFTRTVSMLGFPALVTPMGADPRGLPIALQLIGRPHSEALLLRAGDAFERAARWHERRPTL